jgi:capsular polysaccharide biosynthesis protein
MGLETLDLRWIMRRIGTAIGVVAVCGLLAGIAVAALHPPVLTSTALVLLPQSASNTQPSGSSGQSTISSYTATQMVIADSNPVLTGALPDVRPAMSLDELRSVVQVTSVTSNVISVSARERLAADAEATANAVADSYIAYVNSPSSPTGHVSAVILQPATSATGTRPLKLPLVTGLIGVPAGALIGIIVSLAFGRRDLWFRQLPQ